MMSDTVTPVVYYNKPYATCPNCDEEQEICLEYVSAQAPDTYEGDIRCENCDKIFRVSW